MSERQEKIDHLSERREQAIRDLNEAERNEHSTASVYLHPREYAREIRWCERELQRLGS